MAPIFPDRTGLATPTSARHDRVAVHDSEGTMEPKWVDVIVKRWERHTGKKAKRVPADAVAAPARKRTRR